MKRGARTTVGLTFVSVACCLASVWMAPSASGQSAIPVPARTGAEGTPAELEAWAMVEQNKMIKAREMAERVVAENPQSFVGHLVLGYSQRFAEANFPRALFHFNESLRLYELRFGREPGPTSPWLWHARIIREIGSTYGDLERYEEQLAFSFRYNERYFPKIIAERAWPLMKLRRYDDARTAAREGLATGEPRQVEIALNALCAVEYEAGDENASYRACREALDQARRADEPDAVDFTNFAEGSRSLFLLGEAERILLEATRAPPTWYGNPWLELGELYTRQARYPEALGALKEVPAYRGARPPHVRDSDRNESRRAVSAFLLAVGRSEEALRITERAMVMPDRRGHNSRDPAQDQIIVALLDRRARRVGAERALERAAARGTWDRVTARAEALLERGRAWMSGRQVVRMIAVDDRLIGSFRLGASSSAVMPPWLLGDVSAVIGPGVTRASISLARARDRRERAPAYYDAVEMESAYLAGDEDDAKTLGERALLGLPDGEALLRGRVSAILADLAFQRGDDAAVAHFERALQIDPGVFRRLEIAIPVSFAITGDAVADDVVSALERSPRLSDGSALRVRGEVTAAGGRVCLEGVSGNVGCGEFDATTAEVSSTDDVVSALVDAFHDEVFAPRISLSQQDANSLDGSSAVSRDIDVL